MASQEDLRKAYPSKITPSIFGRHFNERPQPDALGRSPATPLDVLRAVRGEFNLSTSQQPHLSLNPRKERVDPEWEKLKLEREQRKKAARAAKRR
jgi:hypothetical protein